MPWGATGVVPRIGTSCCAGSSTARTATAAAESNQRIPFIYVSPGSTDTGLSIVLRRVAPIEHHAPSFPVRPARNRQHAPGPDASPVRGGIGTTLARDGYPHGGAGLRITSSQVRIASLLMKDYLAIAFNDSPKQIVAPTGSTRYGSM